MSGPSTETASPWVKTPVANLVRYKPSGIYFARAKVGGKLIRQSLKTDALSVAKLRLQDLLASEQQKLSRQKTVEAGKLTFSDALQIYKERLEKNAEIKLNTKRYQEELLIALDKSWPELKSLDIRKITEADCLNWRSNFVAHYSPTRVNGAISLLRRIFQIAIDAGAILENPMLAARRAKVRKKDLMLPETEQFRAFLKEIENGGSRFSKSCADLVCFMAYGGFRKTEAANVTWGDCDLNKKKIVVRGDPDTGTKNGEIREVPMIPEMQTLLGRLKAENKNLKSTDKVMKVHECQKAMNRAALLVGMRRITHHDLRHLFATRCIESGVDIPTVSRWLGHKDGGALAMKVYGHLRDQHSAIMAEKVSFSTKV
jgi:integrase